MDNSILENTEETRETGIGEIHKRRETMADNRRYIIYYTFDTKDELGTITDEENDKSSSINVPDSSLPENV